MLKDGAFEEGDWAELCTYVDGEHREVELTDVQLAVVKLMLGLGLERPFSDDELVRDVLPAALSAASGTRDKED